MREKDIVVETCPLVISNNLILNETISSNHNYIIINSIAYVLKRFPAMVSHNRFILDFSHYIEKLLKTKET